MGTKRNHSMRRYIIYVSVVILLLCGLTFVLSSCTEEPADSGVHSGKKVGVRFSLNDVNYSGSEVIMQNPRNIPAETVAVPLADGLMMVATLEENQQVMKRVATSCNLNVGTKLRIVAYTKGTTYHAHADYTVSGTSTVPGKYDLDGVPLQVVPGNYRFVAYSYNSTTTLPGHDDYTLSGIDPAIDLLWGKHPLEGGTIAVSATTTEVVSIKMSHLLSQMTIEATTTDLPGSNLNITAITDVTMPGKNAKLSPVDGTLTPDGDVVQDFPAWSNLGSTTVTSLNPRTVYTGGNASTVVQFGSVTLSGTIYPNLTAVFNKQLQKGVSYTIKVHFRNANEPAMISIPPTDFLPYVGAFWKADQTGERLIRIPQSASKSADGEWTATVLVGNEWIVLDKVMTTDPNVGWRPGANESLVHNGNDSNFDANHPVNSTLTTVIGNMNDSEPQIYFRIGLRSKLTNYPAVPARYGVVLLKYKNNTLKHRIWIRQGEGNDYMMSNSDPVNSGGLNYRTVTKRFTPYNLTAKILDAHADASGAVPSVNPGIFTEYPSQAGAFFQWAEGHSDLIRMAWNPYTPTAQGWDSGPAIAYWDTIKVKHETCPPGYRRPNDGSTTGDESAQVITFSEMRQSLYQNPQIKFNYSSNLDNCVWGYYADGFFDRRAITNKTAVASGTRNTAHIGQLFYNTIATNERYCASLFFPVAGNRYHSIEEPNANGHLLAIGSIAGYWTSSSSNQKDAHNAGICLFVKQFSAGPWYAAKGFGFSIRCVVDE